MYDARPHQPASQTRERSIGMFRRKRIHLSHDPRGVAVPLPVASLAPELAWATGARERATRAGGPRGPPTRSELAWAVSPSPCRSTSSGAGAARQGATLGTRQRRALELDTVSVPALRGSIGRGRPRAIKSRAARGRGKLVRTGRIEETENALPERRHHDHASPGFDHEPGRTVPCQHLEALRRACSSDREQRHPTTLIRRHVEDEYRMTERRAAHHEVAGLKLRERADLLPVAFDRRRARPGEDVVEPASEDGVVILAWPERVRSIAILFPSIRARSPAR